MNTSTRPSPLVLGLVLLGVAEAVAIVVVSIALGDDWQAFVDRYSLINTVLGGTITILAGAVITRHPGHRLGWLLLICAVGLPAQSLAGLLPDLLVDRATPVVDTSPFLQLLLSAPVALWVPFVACLMTLVPLWFPTGEPLSPRWRPVQWAVAVCAIWLTAAFALLTPPFLASPETTVGQYINLDGGLSLSRLEDTYLTMSTVGFSALLILALLSFASLVARFRRARGVERAQFRMVLLTAGVGLPAAAVLQLGTTFQGGEEGALGISIGVIAVPLGIGLAILRYRLFDIDRLVSRTLAFVLLSGSLAAIYAGSVLLLSSVIGGGDDTPPVAVAAGTLLAAVAFNPLRTRLQALIDRRLFRSRADARAAVDALGIRLRDRVDIVHISGDVVEVVDGVMAPATVRLWLPPGDRADVVTAHRPPSG